jgi:hypothetical protein
MILKDAKPQSSYLVSLWLCVRRFAYLTKTMKMSAT